MANKLFFYIDNTGFLLDKYVKWYVNYHRNYSLSSSFHCFGAVVYLV
ncbi:hypothetical protein J2S74_002124 [Evansella vedderi]|uniref:Uncharacterized protein n=1 Tax=Evansella vedderi TaxID=38282 RepID=A0ABT9ZU25_9BACI|nr:hypothetical protein [Evansella vedderi]MDQ0254745.1 hypothetical protein [Evansella vedderi]